MAKETPESGTKAEPTLRSFKIEIPKFPDDFRGDQYANEVNVSASAQEVFFDLFQGGPEAGGSGGGRVVFVGRFIFPLALSKTIIARLQGLVETIEKDTGIKVPEPEEE